jgi:hypothetical protein
MIGDNVRSLERGIVLIRSCSTDAPLATATQTSHTHSSR